MICSKIIVDCFLFAPTFLLFSLSQSSWFWKAGREGKWKKIKVITNNLTDSKLVTLLSRHLRSPGNHCPLICYWTSLVPALEDKVGTCFPRRFQRSLSYSYTFVHLDSHHVLWGIMLFHICFYFSPSANIWALFWSKSRWTVLSQIIDHDFPVFS